jgi:hypothetical protein
MGKTFTLEEANRTLVFVAPVLKEIQTIWGALMGFQASEDGTAEAVIRSKVERLKPATQNFPRWDASCVTGGRRTRLP